VDQGAFGSCLDPRLGYQLLKIEPAEKYTESVIIARPVAREDAPTVAPEDEHLADCYFFKIKKRNPGKAGWNSCITEIAPLLECS